MDDIKRILEAIDELEAIHYSINREADMQAKADSDLNDMPHLLLLIKDRINDIELKLKRLEKEKDYINKVISNNYKALDVFGELRAIECHPDIKSKYYYVSGLIHDSNKILNEEKEKKEKWR